MSHNAVTGGRDARDARDEHDEATSHEQPGDRASSPHDAEWLTRYTPSQWIAAAMQELRRAEAAYVARDLRGGLASAKRGAGMALNAALCVEPKAHWGRSYVDHLRALAREPAIAERVRNACETLLGEGAPSEAFTATHRSLLDLARSEHIVALRTPSADKRERERVLDAARDITAYAYAVVIRHSSKP